jgi:hypothetical protein
MNLSISSSKAAVLAVIGTLVCGEVALRAIEARLSGDLRHIIEIPEIVERFRETRPPRVLFLGNSLTREGVDRDAFGEELEQTGRYSVSSGLIHPDDTTIVDWYYIYRRFIAERGVRPDILVLGFIGPQLNDGQQLHVNRLARYFAGRPLMGEAFRSDVKDFDGRVQYFLSANSTLFASAERLRVRILLAVIPSFRTGSQIVNHAIQAGQRRKTNGSPAFSQLDRFLRMVTEQGTKVVIVAMPQPQFYPVPDLLIHTVRQRAFYFDLRKVQGVDESEFIDGFHLSPRGAALYSKALAGLLMHDAYLARTLAGAPRAAQ